MSCSPNRDPVPFCPLCGYFMFFQVCLRVLATSEMLSAVLVFWLQPPDALTREARHKRGGGSCTPRPHRCRSSILRFWVAFPVSTHAEHPTAGTRHVHNLRSNSPRSLASGSDSDLIGSSDLLPPLPQLLDGGVKMCFFSFCFSLSGFFFPSPSIITCPRDWVTFVQSEGNGNLFHICCKRGHPRSNPICRRSRTPIPDASPALGSISDPAALVKPSRSDAAPRRQRPDIDQIFLAA